MTHSISSVTIDVAHLRDELKPGRPYAWWRRFTPLWLDVELNDDGSVTFTPNDYLTRKLRKPPTPLKYKSMLHWIADSPAFLDGAVEAAR